ALAPAAARAGGPRYVAGVSYFNAGVVGQPVHWAGGQLNYYVDQGPLSATVSNQQATAMVDAAAALWSAVPTAAVALTDQGQLAEDVSGQNIQVKSGQITAPADVTPSATAFPVAVLFDQDGSIVDALYGQDASQPLACQNNSVFMWLDNINPDATIVHGVILLNGRCTATADLVAMMSFELERAFGRLLGLDSAQVNPGALQTGIAGGVQGWPVMQPASGLCGSFGGQCLPDPGALRYDDIAALNRIYPVTAENQAQFPGKQLTAQSTVSIQGTVNFRTGSGMQGVNVVARPLDASGNPLYQYTVTFVSGSYFNGNHGNPVTGTTDASGNPLTTWGSNDPSLQGSFDLSGIPLPPGVTSAVYQVSFEAVSPNYLQASSVGPYIDGSPKPSGTLETLTLPALSAGASQQLTVTVADSAAGGVEDAIGSPSQPRPLPSSGLWSGRLAQVGQTDWFQFPVRAGRTFTVITEALDESGAPTNLKAMPALGVWDAFLPLTAPPVGAGIGLNGWATGESWLRVTAQADDTVRLAIADQRGDGRPDYAYQGMVLYAGSVQPLRLPASGGPIVIHGTGFRPADTVLVGGQPAIVTSISPNEITAIAPAAPNGVTGSVDVEVDDLPVYYAAAIISGGLNYDAATGDALTLNTAPSNTVPIGVPQTFTVTALAPDLSAAGGVTVVFAVLSGNATLGCGQKTCTETTSGDGHASVAVTATNSNWSIVTATLLNGSSVRCEFTGGTPPSLAALAPTLSVAAGATVNWTVQALVLNNGAPAAGQAVAWQSSGSGMTPLGSAAALSNASGIAQKILAAGPLAEGQTVTAMACLNGTSQCVPYTAYGARPEFASVTPVSGVTQSLAASGTPAQIVLRLLDMNGNPMAGGAVTLYQSLYAWTPPCPPRGRCAQPQLLATQSGTAISALDGSVVFTPASIPGTATKMLGIAVAGNASSVNLAIEQYP
ncbi:MAG: IPT/TIG domain-containing protein, partial [Terracidiphilus sp.]